MKIQLKHLKLKKLRITKKNDALRGCLKRLKLKRGIIVYPFFYEI